jgi:hypothetical protein
VLFDRALDHLALDGIAVDVADGGVNLQPLLATGHADLDALRTALGLNLADQEVGIQLPAGVLLQVVAVLHPHVLARHLAALLHVQLQPGQHAAALAAHLLQPHVGLVLAAIHLGRGHLDLLDQLPLVGVDGVQPVDHVVLVDVRGRVAQRAQRVHGIQRFLAAPFQAAVHALRLVDDQHGLRGADQIDGLLAAGLLAVLVEVVDVLLVDGAHRHHHHLQMLAGGEVAHLVQLGGVVEEVLEGLAAVERLEVRRHDLQALVDAFLDGHRRHDDHELGEAVTLVQLEHRAQVDVGLARARFHLHREVTRRQAVAGLQAMAQLHLVQVGQQVLAVQLEAVADAQVGLGQAQAQLHAVTRHAG